MRKEEQLTKLSFCYITTEDYEHTAKELKELSMLAKAIKGTQKYHSFIPVSENQIEGRLYSNNVQNNKKVNIFEKQ